MRHLSSELYHYPTGVHLLRCPLVLLPFAGRQAIDHFAVLVKELQARLPACLLESYGSQAVAHKG